MTQVVIPYSMVSTLIQVFNRAPISSNGILYSIFLPRTTRSPNDLMSDLEYTNSSVKRNKGFPRIKKNGKVYLLPLIKILTYYIFQFIRVAVIRPRCLFCLGHPLFTSLSQTIDLDRNNNLWYNELDCNKSRNVYDPNTYSQVP